MGMRVIEWDVAYRAVRGGVYPPPLFCTEILYYL